MARTDRFFVALALCVTTLAGCSEGTPSGPDGGGLPDLPDWDGRREFLGSMTFAGRERSFIGHLPLSYDHERRVPLLLAYHGSGMHAEQLRQVTGLDWIANEHGFAVIYPEASDGFFPIPCPGCENDGRDGYEEIDFARQIIRWTSEKYAVHPDSVYATGFSMGGFFINYMGCAPDSPVRGIAPVAAGARSDFEGFCSSSRPSVLIIHAIQDLVAPIEGGAKTMSIADLAELWRVHGACDATPASWDYPADAVGPPTVHASLWGGCAGAGPVRLDVIDGAGHRWLTSTDNPNEVDLGDVIADFFFPLAP
ncbi:MAG: PHB depolymerase family esterase [Candidatus Palauibacterales bacterium]|nr:PHB depolymerase family esterase [Candidatus Palauibacterales bacterium]